MAALELQNVDLLRGTRAVLQQVSWRLERGETGAILGPNGCGKSSLLRIASGYLWPSRGSVEILSQRLGACNIPELRRKIGLVEASGTYPFDESMTAIDVVLSGFFASLTLSFAKPSREQIERAGELLVEVGLFDRHKQIYQTLSTGQRMRCLIARALVRCPELLLLDEPTTGLDLPTREMLLEVIWDLAHRPEAPAIVLVTHHLDEILPGTRRVLLLSPEGRQVADGPPDQTLTDPLLSACYGCPVHVLSHDGRYHAHATTRRWNRL